jgi:hypothetical protein
MLSGQQMLPLLVNKSEAGALNANQQVLIRVPASDSEWTMEDIPSLPRRKKALIKCCN